jgi:hypothetical protein
MSIQGTQQTLTETAVIETSGNTSGLNPPSSICPWCKLTGRPGKTGSRGRSQRAYVLARHSPKIFVAILGVILLSVLDAALTLFLVSSGAREANPVMAFFLNQGPLVFFWAKYVLTCMPLVFILIHKGVTLFGTSVKAEDLFLWIAVPFALVVNWELYLILYVV